MTDSCVIRACEEKDWPSIWPFFREIAAAGETYTYPRDIGEDKARQLWLERPPGQTVVAVSDDGDVLGSARMGPNQMGPGAHVATASFMVDPASRRRGTGRALGEFALNWARENGFRAMQFNAVVSNNLPAVNLWTSLGFEIVGTVPEAFHHPVDRYVDLYVMYRRL
ncbi:MAG TPA: GNAT family N-acetyltransferase [Gammaproteobacteria bacterium]